MEMFTFHFGHSWVIRAFGRNPLVRMTDRAEAFLLAFAFVAVLVITPVAGAIGTAVHESHARLYAEQAASRQPVAATVAGNPTSMSNDDRVIITAPADPSGNQVGSPPATWQAGVDAVLAGAGFLLGMVICVAGLTAWLRAGLVRRRDSAWEREWQILIRDGGGKTGTQA